ncbi:phytoene/squalene synthase family protein [Flavimaricola marinus]|uniref:Squalene/phytoene synthase n=1 Tax=Flavimaricola marinus TaxID=1819565 RepID=A0A238LEZ4_9RHOB|nr:squalene/phytoene synthase family protein [Flavimaricola marinus]SMY07984.1 Squalene/phytoene synthase [Flavimaricola marinus]
MSVNACAEIVRKSDPDRFLAAMAAPVPLRLHLFVLFALNIEAARAPWVTDEPPIAEIRLQWWRDAVAEIAAGKPARAHEVAAPLAEAMQATGWSPETLDQLIAARRWDIYREPFEDEAHFAEHLDHTAGHLMWLGCVAAGAAPALEPAARAVARAQGIAGWLQAVPDLEARGRVPLLDGRPDGVRALAEAGLAALAQAKGTDFGAAVPVIRTAWRAGPLLRLAKADPAAVAEGRLTTSEFSRRAGLIWRSALKRW